MYCCFPEKGKQLHDTYKQHRSAEICLHPPTIGLQTRPGSQIDDSPYSAILTRQDDFYYKDFADWCATHDGALPRREGPTSEERSLASWFRHKLRLYYSDDLSDEELVRLKKVPAINEHFCLHGQWSLKFALKSMSFEDWCAKHRRLLPQQGETEERSLTDWLKKTIPSYQNGKNPENKLGEWRISKSFSVQRFSLNHSELFDLKCKSFEKWLVGQNGTLPKQGGKSEEERSLANWLKEKLRRYRRGKLSDDQLSKLKKIPAMSDMFGPQYQNRSELFDLKCKRFEDWCVSHNETLPKRNGDTQEERSLALWFKDKLSSYRRGKLSDDQLTRLRKIPVISEVFSVQGKSFRSEHFALKCKNFQDWCAQAGGTLPQLSGQSQEERSLANWLKNKLHSYRLGKLPEEQLTRLRKLHRLSDFPHISQNTQMLSHEFNLTCRSLEAWCVVHNGTLPKQRGKTKEERSLAIWLRDKLFRYRHGKLCDDHLAQLRKIPAISEVFRVQSPVLSLAERFDLKCKNFGDWCATHNGTLPRQRGTSKKERSLGDWLWYKLKSYRRGKLSENQLARLRAIPEVASMFESSGT